jgi:hypothetical protein
LIPVRRRIAICVRSEVAQGFLGFPADNIGAVPVIVLVLAENAITSRLEQFLFVRLEIAVSGEFPQAAQGF